MESRIGGNGQNPRLSGSGSNPSSNRVTLFGKLRERLTKAAAGDLVRITGRVRQTSNEAEGSNPLRRGYDADGFAILAKASGKPAND